MSLMFFELLLLPWNSERVIFESCEFVLGPFKIFSTFVSSSLLSFSVTICTGFHSQMLQGLIFLALMPWAG